MGDVVNGLVKAVSSVFGGSPKPPAPKPTPVAPVANDAARKTASERRRAAGAKGGRVGTILSDSDTSKLG